MRVINSVDSKRFSLDGIEYFKNYISEVAGNQITIFNAYDRKDIKVDWENYGNITLNSVIYDNVADLQSALLPVIYTRASLGGGGGGAVDSVNGQTGVVELGLEEILTQGNESTTQDAIFRLDADRYIKINRATQTIEFFDTSVSATAYSYLDKAVLNLGNSDIDWQITLDGEAGGIQITDISTGNSLIISKSGIELDGISYPFPTGATSQIATLLDIANNVPTLQEVTDEGATTTNAIETGNIVATDLGGDAPFYGKYDTSNGIGKIVMEDTSTNNFHELRFNTPTAIRDIAFPDASGNVALLTTSITNGDTTHAPNGDAVFDALALKQDKSASAYKMRVNNTNATANVTETDYRSPSVQSYVDTPTFPGGTAPTTPIGLTYNWQRVGNWVKANFAFVYTNAGATITQVLIPMPSDMPNPVVPTGFTGASAVLYLGSGNMVVSSITATGVSSSDMYSYLARNSADTGFEFGIAATSGSYKVFRITIEYPTS